MNNGQYGRIPIETSVDLQKFLKAVDDYDENVDFPHQYEQPGSSEYIISEMRILDVFMAKHRLVELRQELDDVLVLLHRANASSNTMSMAVTKMQLLVTRNSKWVADQHVHHAYLQKMRARATELAVYVDNLTKLGNGLHAEYYTIIDSIHKTRLTLEQHY